MYKFSIDEFFRPINGYDETADGHAIICYTDKEVEQTAQYLTKYLQDIGKGELITPYFLELCKRAARILKEHHHRGEYAWIFWSNRYQCLICQCNAGEYLDEDICFSDILWLDSVRAEALDTDKLMSFL